MEFNQADRYKKHYETHSEILTIAGMSFEIDAESLKDMVDYVNGGDRFLLLQGFGYEKRVQLSVPAIKRSKEGGSSHGS